MQIGPFPIKCHKCAQTTFLDFPTLASHFRCRRASFIFTFRAPPSSSAVPAWKSFILLVDLISRKLYDERTWRRAIMAECSSKVERKRTTKALRSRNAKLPMKRRKDERDVQFCWKVDAKLVSYFDFGIFEGCLSRRDPKVIVQ